MIQAWHGNERSSIPLVILTVANGAIEDLLPVLRPASASTGAEHALPPLAPSWLDQALEDLKHIHEEAREEGCGNIASVAEVNARYILEAVRIPGLPAPSIYPTEDQEIAIFFASSKPGAAVLVLCDSRGGGACFASIEGKNGRARFDDAADIPRRFLIDELRSLRATL